MYNKKSQSEVITTILIILLVLAAIVIVWQVIQGTVKRGAQQLEQKSGCFDLIIDITKTDTTAEEVSIRPTRDIAGYRVYVNGVLFGEEGGILSALSTVEITGSGTPPQNLESGDSIEVFGKIGEVWCPTTKETVK